MPFKIVRNDITKMNTEAIVNTANDQPTVGTGCDHAVYQAAGYEELLAYRKEKIGAVPEGDAFITPGFNLPARYIIHAVSPLYIDGKHDEEELLRSCYRKSLALAAENRIQSIAFPLISTGGFGYPKEEGMRIAVDEIHAFLMHADMEIYLVVFDEKATRMGKHLYPDLEAYIDLNYVQEKREEEYGSPYYAAAVARREEFEEEGTSGVWREEFEEERASAARREEFDEEPPVEFQATRPAFRRSGTLPWKRPDGFEEERAEAERRKAFQENRPDFGKTADLAPAESVSEVAEPDLEVAEESFFDDRVFEEMERKLEERMAHMSDGFPEYLLYLIQQKGLKNADVYKRAIVDKKVFSKIKNNPDYHPQKLTALCLCIGAKLTLDESRDLLARAGYALSPSDKTDIIFSYFIEHGIYDMIELDIQLEEHGQPCIIA